MFESLSFPFPYAKRCGVRPFLDRPLSSYIDSPLVHSPTMARSSHHYWQPIHFVFRVLFFAMIITFIGVIVDTAKAQSYTTAQLADGFEYPVGRPNGAGYYVYRGFSPGGHLGEDWNGDGGGNTDLGDAVTCIANGVVVFSEDYHRGWGNVVIVRHAYREKSGQIAFIDSLYGHLQYRSVRLGEKVSRGQKLGAIGTGPYGMYAAHLHFEIRKDLRVGMRRDLYPKSYATYHYPRHFLNTYRILRYESRHVRIPINTFLKSNPNRIETTKIDPPKTEVPTTLRPEVSETVATAIEKETSQEETKPAKSKGLLEKLFSSGR